MKDKTAIFFSPHPDDETFGCGGTIAKKLSEGYQVIVVILTDGRNAYLRSLDRGTEVSPEDLVKIRRTEEKKAMRILGLREKNLVFLDFEDGTLEQNMQEAEKEAIRILMDHRPAEVYSVYEGDAHPDHRAASRIVKSAIKKADISTTQYEYSISPRYGRLGALARLINRRRHNVLYVDVSDFLSIKEEAMREFRSQVSIISDKQRRPVVKSTARFVRSKEIFLVPKN